MEIKNKVTMTTMQLPADFKFKGKPLLIIAIGVTLAFLPSIIGLMTLIGGAYYEGEDYSIPLFVQTVGAAIMIVGYSNAYRQVKQLKIKKSGFILGIIASSIGFAANLLFGLTEQDYLPLHIGWVVGSWMLLLVLGFLSVSPLLAISSFKISKYFTKFRAFGICMAVVSGVILASYLIWFVFPGVIRLLALGMSLVGALTAAWMLTKAKPLKACETKSESKVPMPEVVAAPIEDHSRYMPKEDHSRYMPKEDHSQYMPKEDHSRYMPKEESAETKSGLSDEIVNLLMGYDNARLKEIIENPYRYNPAVVEEAGLLLRRRLAWEQIKDLSDKELLAMTMAPKGLYDADIVEAAAMELYQRESQLLREQFMMMVPDAVSDLASGRTPAPEGIRLAAQRYLSKFTRP
ncbi:MAG: hypothetical protein PUD39_09050 [Bacteroidales bacterium]|nr:hypothetical protein [Bacteroidales bacterium]